MRVTFIKPDIGRPERGWRPPAERMEPLMLGVLAGLTPPDVECVLYDDRVEPVAYDEPTDLVAITVETYTARRAYEIAAAYRARGVPVVLGGMHVTLAPLEAAGHADSIFVGDAEGRWAEVVEDARLHRLKPRYDSAAGAPQTGGVVPRRDLFRGKGYLPVSLVQFGRGCAFPCRFCAVSAYFERKYHRRPIDELLREIEAQDRRLLFFVDDNIAADRRALVELCHALIPLRVNWVGQASLDVARDPALLRLLERSGNWGNVMGFESITPESLREARKTPNIPHFARYREEVRLLREHGLQTWAAFMLGFDHDTRDTIEETVAFALESRFAFAAFNILMPYPGTELYDRLEREGRLLYGGRWWLDPDYRFNAAAFRPARLSADELTEVCRAGRARFNSLPALLRRLAAAATFPRSAARTAAYWRYALLFRREVRRKHAMRFGMPR
jgi:radical SAM superfamily enzyme YgiQ (UPF0313 family)